MKNIESWHPSKFVIRDNRLRASRATNQVGIASRLAADTAAHFYEVNLPKHTKGRLLDLGCGRVPLYGTYKPYVTEAICVDWPNTMHPNPHLDQAVDLNFPLPFESNSFDTIVLSDVLEHIRQPEQLWKEMYRVLAPNGKVLLNVPFYYWIHEEPFDYFRYTKYALKSMAEDAGFHILLLEPLGGVPHILADVSAKTLVNMRFIGKFMAEWVQRFTRLFLKTGYGKRLFISSSEHFPFGYSMVVQKPM